MTALLTGIDKKQSLFQCRKLASVKLFHSFIWFLEDLRNRLVAQTYDMV